VEGGWRDGGGMEVWKKDRKMKGGKKGGREG